MVANDGNDNDDADDADDAGSARLTVCPRPPPAAHIEPSAAVAVPLRASTRESAMLRFGQLRRYEGGGGLGWVWGGGRGVGMLEMGLLRMGMPAMVGSWGWWCSR